MPYDAGQIVSVDGIEYTIVEAISAFKVTDPEGNEILMDEATLDASSESVEDPAAPDESEVPVDLSTVDMKKLSPEEKSQLMAKLKKQAGM